MVVVGLFWVVVGVGVYFLGGSGSWCVVTLFIMTHLI